MASNFNGPALDKNPVFASQRNDIGHRAKGYEIQFALKIEPIQRPSFKKGVTKFEGNSSAAEIMKRRAGIDFGIHNRDTIG